MFLFDTPKNIRKHSLIEKKKQKTLGFLMFSGGSKGNIGGKRVNN